MSRISSRAEVIDNLDPDQRGLNLPTSAVIRGYEYRWFAGMAVPYLTFLDDVGEGAFPLLGYHMFDCDSRSYCSECLVETRPMTHLCKGCESSDTMKRLRCILDGPGVPFDTECSQDSPPCELEQWAARVCYTEWMIYVASVFGVLKVGISRKARGGCELGFTQRLLNQGAGEWISMGPAASLKEALYIEEALSRDLSLAKRVTSSQKWECLENGGWRTEIPRADIELWASETHLSIYMESDFKDCFVPPSEGLEYERSVPQKGMNGHLVAFVGPIVMFSFEGETSACDLNQVAGLAILGEL